MVNSIRYFEEECIKKFEKYEDDFIRDPSKIAEYVAQIENELHTLGLQMIKETLENMDGMLQKSGKRRAKWVVESHVEKQLITSLGTVQFHKTLFTNKETGKSEYLLDRILGLGRNERLTEDAQARILEEAVQTSYKRGGDAVSLTTEVSKQTTKNLLHGLRFPKEEPPKEKKQVDYLYIEADEDHVSLQFRNQKGDLMRSENGQKNNGLITKLAYVHEGIEKEAPKSKRYKLIHPHYFCSTSHGKRNEAFWDEIYEYLDSHYDLEKVKKIYLSADGGGWIKSGMKRIAGITYVLDEFHLEKYLTRLTSHMKDSQWDAKEELKKVIKRKTKGDFLALTKRLEWYLEDETGQERIAEARNYILSNWNAARLRLKHQKPVIGSSTEGHVSHILSSRMSSRPMGWSIKGADQMARLRAYYKNGGNMLELIRYQKKELPVAVGEEYKVLYTADLIRSERSRHGQLGKYTEAISHSIHTENRKIAYFNQYIWDL